MADTESCFQEAWLPIQTIRFMNAMAFVKKGLIGRLDRPFNPRNRSNQLDLTYLWKITFVVQYLQNSMRFFINQIQTISIIGKVDSFPREFLFSIFVLREKEEAQYRDLTPSIGSSHASINQPVLV